MTKNTGWTERGSALAGLVTLHTKISNGMSAFGLGPEALDWALTQGEGDSAFNAALTKLAEDYHASRVIDSVNPTSMQVSTGVTPLLPYASAKVLENLARGWVKLQLDKHGALYRANSKVHLHEVSLPPTDEAVKLESVLEGGLRVQICGLGANEHFALMRYPQFVPDAWKTPTNDGHTPFIVFPGTLFQVDHYPAVLTMYWDVREGKMVGGVLNTKRVLNGPRPHLNPELGGARRTKLYVAAT